jgi:hypothetical protein
VSRHGFGDCGCAYCQYVDVAPALSGAQMLAELVGLPVERIVALERDDGRLSEADAQALAIGGRYGDRPPAAGSRLVDLRRRADAQASIVSGAGDLRVSAPHVSALAGVVALAEIIKHGDPSLAPFRLGDRVDLDLSGQPSGFVGVARPGRLRAVPLPFRVPEEGMGEHARRRSSAATSGCPARGCSASTGSPSSCVMSRRATIEVLSPRLRAVDVDADLLDPVEKTLVP